MLGFLLEIQGRFDEAQQQYQKALEFDPRTAAAANNLAWLYASRGGNLDVALQLAQAAKAGLPDSPEVSDTMGWIYLKKGLRELAVGPLEFAARSDAGQGRLPLSPRDGLRRDEQLGGGPRVATRRPWPSARTSTAPPRRERRWLRSNRPALGRQWRLIVRVLRDDFSSLAAAQFSKGCSKQACSINRLCRSAQNLAAPVASARFWL